MMNELIAGTICYNSLKELKRLAPTIQPFVDKWVVVDGKFTQMKGDTFVSDDGTQEWLKQFDNVIYRQVVGWQCDKRTEYCTVAKEINAPNLLIIDSDEFVIDADWKLFKENMRKANASSHYHSVNYIKASGQQGWYPRLWTNPGQVFYFHAHNIFMDESGNIQRSTEGCVDQISGITITQNDDLRTPEMIEKAYQYQVGMIKHEKPIRKRFKS